MPPPINQSHALSQVGVSDFTPFAQDVDSSLQVSTSSQPPYAHHTLVQHSTHPHLHSYTPSQNGFHDTTIPAHSLSKTTSLSSYVASPQYFSTPHSSHLSLNQGGGAVGVGGGGQISVGCEMHGVSGYHDDQLSMGNQEAEDVIRQFLS